MYFRPSTVCHHCPFPERALPNRPVSGTRIACPEKRLNSRHSAGRVEWFDWREDSRDDNRIPRGPRGRRRRPPGRDQSSGRTRPTGRLSPRWFFEGSDSYTYARARERRRGRDKVTKEPRKRPKGIGKGMRTRRSLGEESCRSRGWS